MEVIKILKRILCTIMAVIMMSPTVLAYDYSNLPQTMSFREAAGINDSSEIASATICDIDGNKYKNLTRDEITYFFNTAKDLTLWRKINPTPFRGVCVNMSKYDGTGISYYYNSGVQTGTYGEANYICYMPSGADTQKLTYLMSEFYDTQLDVYGGGNWNVVSDKDFLKLPRRDWAKESVKEAAT